MKKNVLLALAVFAFLFNSSTPSLLQNKTLQHELNALASHGTTYRFVDATTIEMKDKLSGNTWRRSLSEPSEATIRGWARSRGIPILEINPSLIDTTKYTGWYNYWALLPVAGDYGVPLLIDDIDRNGKPEGYGFFANFSFNTQTQVYEIDSTGSSIFLYDYAPPRAPRQFANVNADSLREMVFTYGGSLYDFEQTSVKSLPTRLNFEHRRWTGNLDPGFTGLHVGSLDGDSLIDYLDKGSEGDSSKVYVAEYDHTLNNFVRVWSTDYGFNGNVAGIGGFAVGDFDGDGRMEFVVTDLLSGLVFLSENTGDNSYAQTWQDQTPFVNQYYLGSGDVDGDGKPEFFVGATMSNGNWTTMYEADSNDHYSAKFLFHLLSGGTFDEPTYLSSDMDGDGKPELIIFSGADLYVFKSTIDNDYSLWYYKRVLSRRTVQTYKFFGDSKPALVISRDTIDGIGRIRYYSDIFRPGAVLSVPKDVLPRPDEIQLLPNYPNPFNPTTSIEYSAPTDGFVSLIVYDILGREAVVLEQGLMKAGSHVATFDASHLASGIYFYRLSAGNSMTRKMVLIK